MGALSTPSPTVLTPITLKHILFTTDFSTCSDAALPFAVAMAKRYGATIHITHVLAGEARPPIPTDRLPAQLDPAHAEAQRSMERLERSAGLRDVVHEPVIRQGDLWPVLSDLVETFKIDLVVTGTHGREGLSKLLLGSAAEQIFRLAPCPVMTVGPHVTPDVMRDGKFHRILFATDFSYGSEHALPYAVSMAQEDHAQLTLLHAVYMDSAAPIEVGQRYDESRLIATSQQRLRELIPANAGLWAEPEYISRIGNPVDVILQVAAEERASIVIMGVHRMKTGATHNPWTIADKVVVHSHCPVLTVRG